MVNKDFEINEKGKEDLIKILKDFKEACKDTSIKVTDKVVFENAVKMLISNQINSKTPDFEKEIVIKDPNAPATESQKKTLHSLGLKDIPAGLTKLEASLMISENIKHKKQLKETIY